MKITRIDGYYKHGCNFAGKLAVVEYQDDMERDPKWGVFGSMIDFKYSAKAQKLAEERYPGCTVLLHIPDVVVRLPESGG